MGTGGYKQINKALNICAFDDYLATQQTQLPELEDVQQLSPRVIRVLGQNPGKFTLQGTNTYIVGTGEKRMLIDTGQGIPEWACIISSTLHELGVSLSHVLLTHWHGDHTKGVPDLLVRYPELGSSIYKNSPGKGQQDILDNQIFEVEGATIRALHSPGHSHDHMCFILEEDNAMFTGDNILGHGSSAVEELGTYMATLEKMLPPGCIIGYPAHGVVLQNLPAKITGELTQKLRRESQVLKELKQFRQLEADEGSSLSLKELVTMIYGPALDDEVRITALEPFINEVLRKLTNDGRVAFRVISGQKRWFLIE
ncbi:putative metallo-beta-lactamase domain protein [Xylaria scruposa]|nr:putative metallo-beta-lactamase domain protein [Xylaria scruposa]